MEPTLNMELTFDQVSALHKTIGIAIDNLNRKVNERGPDSKLGREALSELNALAAIQRNVLDILANY